MPVGKVCFYHVAAGFGIIEPDGGGADAFVHSSAVDAARMTRLRPDQRIRYTLRTDARGQTCAQELRPE